SFFVSRIDSLTDKRLEEAAAANPSNQAMILALRGKTAVANAKLAYVSFRRIFGTDEWKRLATAGAWVQRPLWASTSTKNPSYPDTLYVDTLVGMHCVNTMPLDTIHATQDHGKITPNTVESNLEDAREHFGMLALHGISFQTITDQLLDEAIQKFNEPYDKLLASLGEKMAALTPR
ncbi:MAG: transaldolase family protein, partial [Candidatus Eisenbacteria bacterium]